MSYDDPYDITVRKMGHAAIREDVFETLRIEALKAEYASTAVEVWNRWAPDALESPLAPAALVNAYNRWQPDHLKIRTSR